jgi:hypothetical protein
MWGEMLLRWLKKEFSEAWSWGHTTKVSSTNQNQHLGLRWKLFKAKASKCSIKMLATTGDKEDPMVVPSVCS